MTPAPQVQHRLLIRHPSALAIALVAEPTGARLPSLVAEDRHTAETDYINDAVRTGLGLVTTVLRSLLHSDPKRQPVIRVHELETHGGTLSGGAHWCDYARLEAVRSGDDAAVIADWLAEQQQPLPVQDGREWQRPGWLDEVRQWLVRTLAGMDQGDLRDIEQLRAWPSSCVLRIRSAKGQLYFKAAPRSLRHECVVTDYLAQLMPELLAPVVAHDPARRWLLTRACPGPKLEDVADPLAWERAVAAYARLQVACATRVGELRRLGCEERRLDSLAEAIEPLCTDVGALRAGEDDGLSAVEYTRLRASAPALRWRCAELYRCGIPPTIEHGDLWPGNFLIDGPRCVVIDWEDVAIAHPFLSLAPFVVGLRLYQPALYSAEMVRRIEAAYLEPFAQLAPMQTLEEALRLARPLSFFDMAVRYRRQRPSIVRLHPWMSDLVSETVRLALRQLDG